MIQPARHTMNTSNSSPSPIPQIVIGVSNVSLPASPHHSMASSLHLSYVNLLLAKPCNIRKVNKKKKKLKSLWVLLVFCLFVFFSLVLEMDRISPPLRPHPKLQGASSELHPCKVVRNRGTSALARERIEILGGLWKIKIIPSNSAFFYTQWIK